MMRFTAYNLKTAAIVITAASFLFLCSACSPAEGSASEPVTKTEFALDTICSITLYGTAQDTIFNDCFQRVSEIEQEMSVNRKESEISDINRNAGVAPVKVSEDTYRVISAGKQYSGQLSGKFDISVGPLVNLWGINRPDHVVPAAEAVKKAAELVDYRKIELNDAEHSVLLKEKGMSLDLGGIAKGYAGDAVAELLKNRGVEHAIVDLGGNLVVIGTRPDGQDWNVGVQTPFQPDGTFFAILNVSDQAVVTSGIYQRYFKKDGKLYHHIMDTETGYPVDNGLVSVTVICDSSMEADALAKSFTLGLEEGLRYIEGQTDAEAIFVTDQNEVYTTSGLKNKLRITDKAYRLKQFQQS